MSGNISDRVFLGFPRAVVSFLGISAMIVGILAMHVWMGGHGAGAHGTAGPSTAVATVTSHHSAGKSGHVEGPPSTQDVSGTSHPGIASDASFPDAGAFTHGCAGACGEDGTALGLCVLALIVVTVLAFLLPTGRVVPGAPLLREPPRIVLRPLSIPAPSLIRLCISRT